MSKELINRISQVRIRLKVVKEKLEYYNTLVDYWFNERDYESTAYYRSRAVHMKLLIDMYNKTYKKLKAEIRNDQATLII